MLILTQDGCRVVKFKDIINLAVSYDDNDNYTIYCDTNNEYEIEIGTYKDKERCKEVLKKFIYHYDKLEKSKLYARSGDTDGIIVSFIYEMPEE